MKFLTCITMLFVFISCSRECDCDFVFYDQVKILNEGSPDYQGSDFEIWLVDIFNKDIVKVCFNGKEIFNEKVTTDEVTGKAAFLKRKGSPNASIDICLSLNSQSCKCAILPGGYKYIYISYLDSVFELTQTNEPLTFE